MTQKLKRSARPAEHTLNDQKAKIRALAAKHGFEMCRFARPGVPEPQQSSYQAWFAAGMHGEMAWMAEESRVKRRKQPESMLENVRTVISVGMRHTPPPYSLGQAVSGRSRGIIASYAHGDDYHDVMKKRLKALARDLDALLGAHDQRVYVDTAPVLEHTFAGQSGLGWQGRHSLTINRDKGSWMMLGEIFTSANIDADAPAVNHCGSCTACMDICPTRAIVAPYVVDARLCISYLTIEYRGFIPHALRPLMGNHIFGCDDCQMICPWNRHASTPPADLRFDLLGPREENALPELSGLLQLDEGEFRQRFRKSPVRRTGRAGLLRNICIAAGNSGDPDFVPDLMILMNDEAPLIRGHAAWALGELAGGRHDEHLRAALEQRIHVEKDNNVLEEINLSIRKTD